MGRGTNFSLFSEHAERVELCLFDADDNETRIEVTERTAYNWHCYVPDVGTVAHHPPDPEDAPMTATLRSLPGQPSHRPHPPVAVLADPPRRVRRPRRAPTEATYRRRRAAVGVLVAGLVGSAALVAGNVLTGPGGVPASAAGAGQVPLPLVVYLAGAAIAPSPVA